MPQRPRPDRRVVVAAIAAVVIVLGGGVALLAARHPLGRLLVRPGHPAILLGRSVQLSADAPGGGRPRVRWRSSAPQVVKVSAAGLATAVAAGRARITASGGGRLGAVTVVAVGVARLQLVAPASVGYGELFTPTVRETLTNGQTPATPPLAVTLASAHPSTIAVVGPAQLLANGLGATTVSARGPDGPAATVTVRVLDAVPTNVGTVTAGFVPHAPIDLQVDNGPTARPQSGLQAADIVYEYLTEGGITRFTAVYWHLAPGLRMGPVRSGRPIALPIAQMYSGMAAFSGASIGTYRIFHRAHLPLTTDDCCGWVFFRTSDHYAPSNLFTTGHLLLGALHQRYPRLAREQLGYVLLPPHPDPLAVGPVRAVSIDMSYVNEVSYQFDPAQRVWLRSLNGTPQVDMTTGRPLAVRNLVLLQATFQYTHYLEDVLGSHGIIWHLDGSGPFRAFIDGQEFTGRWHRPASGGPIYYTLADGHPLSLQTGLTLVEVVTPAMAVTVSR